jgi:hypothetical protein
MRSEARKPHLMRINPDYQAMRTHMTASLTVFVCSTVSDLSQEREGVLDAVRRLKLLHDSMEFFGARAGQPIETCLQEVRASDVLVVIVGHRYGSIVPELEVSYSEAEYAEGFRLKKPCLVYMRDDNVPISPRHMECDPNKLKLLERWKETLRSRHTVATFQDGNRLAVQVAADLARTIRDLEKTAQAMPVAKATLSHLTNRNAEAKSLPVENNALSDEPVIESVVLSSYRVAGGDSLKVTVRAKSKAPVNWLNRTLTGPVRILYGGGSGTQFTQERPDIWVHTWVEKFSPWTPLGQYILSRISVRNEAELESEPWPDIYFEVVKVKA